MTVLERRLDKTLLTAPVDGIVRVIVAEPGEAVIPGRPVLTLEPDQARWVGFTLREDRIAGLAVGAMAELAAPDGRRFTARIAEMRGLGDFATWRAARAVGDHDLNSFAVRADITGDSDPVAPGSTEPGPIEPGMTFWFRDGR